MTQFGKYKKSLLNETNAELVNARRKKTKKRFWFFTVILVIILGLAIYLAWHPKLLIKNIIVEGNRVLSSNKIENAVNEYLDGRFIYILPNRNAFVFNNSDLKNYLLTNHPIIKDVEISQNVPNDLFINVTERQPHALWCNVVPSDCVFIDKYGYAYDMAPYFSKPLFIVYELPGAGLTKKVLDENSFTFVKNVIDNLYIDNVLVQKIKPTGEGVFEFDVILNDSILITTITTNIEIGANETISRVQALLKSDDVLKHSQTFLKKIDVRYGNQVVYNFY
ncbi:hypothetical protein A3J61_00715 [Candidatus Nomurabacteria bacterium RIFCSPHIGHO2_02_FULL_38_15]|uniref:POTRA domain-containing protein n=1 Tax=Candidatus Nomurabacteria bacterium RIFCSPHIGHO2_02_FULL_38_15 TaxID=1801752 RepID=A0A1F6VQE7_9BACT|nr:MAG: hypothetical protein A3J61_00715 [Candidatus Nomurabacteria bacterium RIFCSPHIGHO2_02_FULL_38_15]